MRNPALSRCRVADSPNTAKGRLHVLCTGVQPALYLYGGKVGVTFPLSEAPNVIPLGDLMEHSLLDGRERFE